MGRPDIGIEAQYIYIYIYIFFFLGMALYVGLWQYMLITEIKVLCVAFLIGYSLRDGAKT